MGRPSSIDQMPEEIRGEIGRLRMRGCTIDQILTKLLELTPDVPSRSALGRHVLRMDMLGEKLRRSRQVAEALVQQLGDAPESTAARLNIELLHNAILDLHLNFAEGDEVSPLGAEALTGDPEGIMMLAKALDSLTRASRTNQDFIVAAERRATEKANNNAAQVVERVGRLRGMEASTIEAIKAGIFGVPALTVDVQAQ